MNTIPKELEFNTFVKQGRDIITNTAMKAAINSGYYEVARYLTDYIITLASSD